MSKNTERIEWNGETRDIEAPQTSVVEAAPGNYLITDGSSFREVFTHEGKLGDGVCFDQVEVKIESPRERIVRERFKVGGGAAGARSGAQIVKAPMPGLVRSVRVAPGDQVERTSTLLVLEAMKMENNILAGVKGRVQKVLITEGASVDKNAPLIEIDLS